MSLEKYSGFPFEKSGQSSLNLQNSNRNISHQDQEPVTKKKSTNLNPIAILIDLMQDSNLHRNLTPPRISSYYYFCLNYSRIWNEFFFFLFWWLSLHLFSSVQRIKMRMCRSGQRYIQKIYHFWKYIEKKTAMCNSYQISWKNQ